MWRNCSRLLGAINLYEIALLALGLLLLRRTRWNRDGVLLLLIQMLFLADGPFLLAETAMASARWGPAFNGALLLLAVVKATIAMRGLEIRLHPRTLGFLVLQLILIYFAFPQFLAHVAVDGIVAAAPMCVAWWIVGMLPALYELLTKLDPLPADAGAPLVVRRAYIVVPWMLLIAHLGFFQWVYRAPFFAGDLAPILIGLAIATLRVRPSTFLKQSDLQILRGLLPAVAAILGLVGTDINLRWGNGSAAVLHPTAMTLATVFLTYAYFVSSRTGILAAGLLTLGGILHLLGLTWAGMCDAATNTMDTSYAWLTRLVPSTALAWGILAIIAAFALLAVGGFFTLRRGTSKPLSP